MSVVSRSINYMVNRLLEGDRERERENPFPLSLLSREERKTTFLDHDVSQR